MGIEDDAIEKLFGVFEAADGGEEILGDKIFRVDLESVQRVRSFCQIEKLAVAINLDDASRAASQRRNTETSGIGKRVQHRSASHVFDQPFSQQACIKIKTRIAVHREVERVPHSMLADFCVGRIAEEKFAAFVLLRESISLFDNSSA